MDGKEMSKVCGICGDKAHGYNFNAITCESCKAFFRRNALRKKEFKCPFDDKCKIDSVTRKFCKKCRLKKCLELGMKKEWILSDEEKLNLRNKIAENRKKRKTFVKVSKVADSTTNSYNFPNVVQLIQNSYTTNNEKISDIGCHNDMYNSGLRDNHKLSQTPQSFVDLSQNSVQSSPASNNSVIREQLSDDYRPNCDSLVTNSSIKDCNDCYDTHCFVPKPHYLPIEEINSEINHSSDIQFTNKCLVITDSSMESIKNNCIESFENFSTNLNNLEINKSVINYNKRDEIPDKVYQKAIELEFAAIPIKEMFNNLSAEEFNRYESEKITELSRASSDLNYKIVENHNIKITSEFSHLLDATKTLASKCDEAIRRLVIMSKKINAFKNLCQHDQIALMKAGCFEILIMRSVVNYNYENEYWAIAMDQNNATKLKLDIFKQAKGNTIYEAHRKFMQTFKQEWIEWNLDLTILDLLTAIILFTPDRPNIIHKETTKLEQQTYMYLLQRYLLSKYKSKCEAKMKFLKLMSKLEELHILHDEHVRIYLEVDPQDVGPLLIEILDLNPYNTIQIL